MSQQFERKWGTTKRFYLDFNIVYPYRMGNGFFSLVILKDKIKLYNLNYNADNFLKSLSIGSMCRDYFLDE